ncbi:hypothetical protein EDB84DRAFT_1280392 [Lactarius hengduanensis]|nr:hypothetical protein EDB84DRAFT_1280392 [Lactarius hengduanensis]
MSASRDSSILSISTLTSENYRLWADDMKSWLQLNGLWRLVSGSEKKPVGKPEVLDSQGIVLTAAMVSQMAMGSSSQSLMSTLSSWDMAASFVQQRTAPRFNAYHTLLSIQKDDSESLESLINKVDEQIRVIQSLSPSSFTLDNLYNELAVMAIIRALPQSFDEVICTISVLDKFDKQSVIQSLRNMDQTRSNLSGTSSAFSATSGPSRSRPRVHQASQSTPSSQAPQGGSSSRPKCDFCSRLGHIEAKCFLKKRLMHQVNPPSSSTASPTISSQSPPEAPQSASAASASALFLLFCSPGRLSHFLECRYWCLSSYDIQSPLDARFEAASRRN